MVISRGVPIATRKIFDAVLPALSDSDEDHDNHHGNEEDDGRSHNDSSHGNEYDSGHRLHQTKRRQQP